MNKPKRFEIFETLSLETFKIDFAATNLNPWLQLFSKSTPSENILILKRNSKELNSITHETLMLNFFAADDSLYLILNEPKMTKMTKKSIKHIPD